MAKQRHATDELFIIGCTFSFLIGSFALFARFADND